MHAPRGGHALSRKDLVDTWRRKKASTPLRTAKENRLGKKKTIRLGNLRKGKRSSQKQTKFDVLRGRKPKDGVEKDGFTSKTEEGST